MKAIIQKELGLPTVEISDPKATIDGGDVLFTGMSQHKFIDSSFRLERIKTTELICR